MRFAFQNKKKMTSDSEGAGTAPKGVFSNMMQRERSPKA